MGFELEGNKLLIPKLASLELQTPGPSSNTAEIPAARLCTVSQFPCKGCLEKEQLKKLKKVRLLKLEVYDDLFFLQKDLLSKVCIRDLKLQKTHIQRAPDPFSAL